MDTPCSPYECLVPFKRYSIDKIDAKIFGVYGFWYKKRCIYVGKAERQPIAVRLMQHWNNSHNLELHAWIEGCYGDIKFAIKEICDIRSINKTERLYISFFDPVTNKNN